MSPPEQPAPRNHWPTSSLHVRKALKYIAQKGAITTEQLVEWDAKHGRRLFCWDNALAAEQYRIAQAGWFLNRFRTRFEGMRVRAYIHVHEDKGAGIDEDAYYPAATISANPAMREQIVGDISRRMTSLASELRMWKLDETERTALLARLAEAME